MSWVPQIEAYFSHVVSQWTYKWLDLPFVASSLNRRFRLEDLKFEFLYSYCKDRFSSQSSLPWLDRAKDKQLSITGLSNLVYEQITKTLEHQGDLIDFYHPDYPPLLTAIPDPPNVLMAKGSLSLLAHKSIGIVGSRKSSRFARQQSLELAKRLAEEGLVVVSGGAIGCDMAAHLGALSSSIRPAPTILVFAGGLSRLYPSCHLSYFGELEAAGALFLSERLWSYPARPFDFPVRNRIISGLALRLLVMQAGERSGAKLTAGLALEQGREVFVLVHENDDIRAHGSRELLEEGAIPFHNVRDFMSVPFVLG